MAKNAHFFEFVVGLKLHESRKADKMHNLLKNVMSNNQLERKHPKVRMRDGKIADLTKLLDEKKISIKEFLAMSADENSMFAF